MKNLMGYPVFIFYFWKYPNWPKKLIFIQLIFLSYSLYFVLFLVTSIIQPLITLVLKIHIIVNNNTAKVLNFEKSLKWFFSKYFFRELSRTFQLPLSELLKLYEGG